MSSIPPASDDPLRGSDALAPQAAPEHASSTRGRVDNVDPYPAPPSEVRAASGDRPWAAAARDFASSEGAPWAPERVRSGATSSARMPPQPDYARMAHAAPAYAPPAYAPPAYAPQSYGPPGGYAPQGYGPPGAGALAPHRGGDPRAAAYFDRMAAARGGDGEDDGDEDDGDEDEGEEDGEEDDAASSASTKDSKKRAARAALKSREKAARLAREKHVLTQLMLAAPPSALDTLFQAPSVQAAVQEFVNGRLDIEKLERDLVVIECIRRVRGQHAANAALDDQAPDIAGGVWKLAGVGAEMSGAVPRGTWDLARTEWAAEAENARKVQRDWVRTLLSMIGAGQGGGGGQTAMLLSQGLALATPIIAIAATARSMAPPPAAAPAGYPYPPPPAQPAGYSYSPPPALPAAPMPAAPAPVPGGFTYTPPPAAPETVSAPSAAAQPNAERPAASPAPFVEPPPPPPITVTYESKAAPTARGAAGQSADLLAPSLGL